MKITHPSLDLIIDTESYSAHHKNKEIDLPKKEFELLILFAQKPGKVFTRDTIFGTVWKKPMNDKGSRTLDVHVRRLRRKFGDKIIITVRGVGYKMEG